MIGVIHSIDDMPNLDEMIEAKNAEIREDQIDGHRGVHLRGLGLSCSS